MHHRCLISTIIEQKQLIFKKAHSISEFSLGNKVKIHRNYLIKNRQ